MANAQSHGGQPAPTPTNTSINIDAPDLKITDPSGDDTTVIPAGTAFDVAMEFVIGGSFKTFLVGLPLTYKVTYTFDGRGNPGGPTQTTGPKPTKPLQYTYKDADTKVTVPATALPAGLYELTAVVTFAGGPPMSAFVDVPLIEIF